jgi:precorrin-2 methylase
VAEQALENQRRALSILDMHHQMIKRAPSLISSKYAPSVIELMFAFPVFSSAQLTGAYKVPKDSAKRILDRLQEGGTVRVVREGSGRRPALYTFPRLIELAEGRGAP